MLWKIVEASDIHVGVLFTPLCIVWSFYVTKFQRSGNLFSSQFIFPFMKENWGKTEHNLVKFWEPENQLLGSTKIGLCRSHPKETCVSFHLASDYWTIDPKKLKLKRNLLGEGKGWSTVPNIGSACLLGRSFRVHTNQTPCRRDRSMDNCDGWNHTLTRIA